MPQGPEMKHIVSEMWDNKDIKPQGVHMPGATKSYNSLQAQTTIENCTGCTTCPTISVVNTYHRDWVIKNLDPIICTQDLGSDITGIPSRNVKPCDAPWLILLDPSGASVCQHPMVWSLVHVTNHVILIPAADSLLSVGATCKYLPVWQKCWHSLKLCW